MVNKDYFYPNGILRSRIQGSLQLTYWPCGQLKRRYDQMLSIDEMYSAQGEKIIVERPTAPKTAYYEGPFLEKPTHYQKQRVQERHALLAEKCPLINLVGQLAEEIVPLAKHRTARLQQKLRSKKIIGFIFYGLGSGVEGTFLLPFLAKNPAHFLVYIVQSSASLTTFLASNHAEDLIKNPQVHFVLDTFGPLSENSLWHQLEQLMLDQVEIEVLASAEKVDQKKLAALFSGISLRAAVEQEVLHAEKIAHNVLKNFQQIAHAFSAHHLYGSAEGQTVVVCGAGPSLDPLIESFTTYRDQLIIIAGGSAITALIKRGITPDLCIVFDPNHEELERLAQVPLIELPLLIGGRLYPEVLATHSGPLGYLRSGTGGLLENYLEEKLGLQGQSLHELLPDESLSVTMICVAFAKQMGAQRILLAGVDLAYWKDMRYAAGVTYSEQAINQDHSLDKIYRRKNNQGAFVTTKKRWLMEAAALGEFAKKQICYNLSKTGLKIPGVVSKDFEDFIPELKTTHFAETIQTVSQKTLNYDFTALTEEIFKSLERCHALFSQAMTKPYGSLTDYMIESELEAEIADELLFAPARSIMRRKKHLTGALAWDFHLQGATWLLKQFGLEKTFVGMELIAQSSDTNP